MVEGSSNDRNAVIGGGGGGGKGTERGRCSCCCCSRMRLSGKMKSEEAVVVVSVDIGTFAVANIGKGIFADKEDIVSADKDRGMFADVAKIG